MRLALVTPPTTEPITLAQAKVQCRVDGSDEDDLLLLLIRAAREAVEQHTNRALITQTWRANLDAFPDDDELRLPKPPLLSVTGVTYLDYADVQQTLATSVYGVDADGLPGRLTLKSQQYWPATSSILRNAVTVTFVAGYGAVPEAVPAPIRAAIQLLVGHLYANREASVVGTMVSQLPLGVEALLALYRYLPEGC